MYVTRKHGVLASVHLHPSLNEARLLHCSGPRGARAMAYGVRIRATYARAWRLTESTPARRRRHRARARRSRPHHLTAAAEAAAARSPGASPANSPHQSRRTRLSSPYSPSPSPSPSRSALPPFARAVLRRPPPPPSSPAADHARASPHAARVRCERAVCHWTWRRWSQEQHPRRAVPHQRPTPTQEHARQNAETMVSACNRVRLQDLPGSTGRRRLDDTRVKGGGERARAINHLDDHRQRDSQVAALAAHQHRHL